MTTSTYYRHRTPLDIDEQKNARLLARYLARRIHPCIAVILAYEKAVVHSKVTALCSLNPQGGDGGLVV